MTAWVQSPDAVLHPLVTRSAQRRPGSAMRRRSTGSPERRFTDPTSTSSPSLERDGHAGYDQVIILPID